MTWLLIVIMGVATYTLRASFLVLLDGRDLHRLRVGLRFVPAAVLSALATAAVLGGDDGRLDARVTAAIFAGAVAWRTRSVAVTVATGMAALWLLQAWSVR